MVRCSSGGACCIWYPHAEDRTIISMGIASIVFLVGGLDRALWRYSSIGVAPRVSKNLSQNCSPLSIRYTGGMIRLTDEQWERIRDHFPEEHIPNGRPGRKPIPARGTCLKQSCGF